MHRHTVHQCPSLRRRGVSAAALVVAGLTAGCQSYHPRPFDPAAHTAAFLARTPDAPEVRAFSDQLASASAPAHFDPADGIDAHEAELIALVFNADLRIARMRAGVTQARADTSGLWQDPTIGVDLTRIIQSTPEPWKIFSTIGLTIPISGRLHIEKQRAGLEHAAELARIAREEWSLRMSVRRTWCEWSALDAQCAASREFLSGVDPVIDLVNRVEQAGEMPRTESRLFRIERATRAAGLAMLESELRQAELRLRQLMGLAPDAPLRLRPGPGPALAHAPHVPEPAELALRSPAVLVARAEYQAAERSLELEIRRQYPDLHIGPGYGREDGQDQILLGLSAPIPVLNANRQGIAEARAQREVARVAAEAALEQAVSAVRAAEARLAAASTRRRTIESEILPLVDAQYADARQVARLGEVSALVLLESLKRQQETRLTFLDALRAEAIAAIDLDELIGPPVPPVPPTSPAPPEPPAEHAHPDR